VAIFNKPKTTQWLVFIGLSAAKLQFPKNYSAKFFLSVFVSLWLFSINPKQRSGWSLSAFLQPSSNSQRIIQQNSFLVSSCLCGYFPV